MQTGLRRFETALQSTACDRYDRISALIASQVPDTVEDCFRYLSDSAVRMGITVQQMVFQASTGLCRVRSAGEDQAADYWRGGSTFGG